MSTNIQQTRDDCKPASGPRTFATANLNLAAWIYATKALPFIGCELRARKTVFVFADTDSKGEFLELRLQSGAGIRCCITLFASQNLMKQRMAEALNERRGKPNFLYGKECKRNE